MEALTRLSLNQKTELSVAKNSVSVLFVAGAGQAMRV